MQNKNLMNTETKKGKLSFKLPNFKNKAVFKRGGYAVMITAVVLIGIIVFNILLSALSNRFMLVYDMTADKVNSISEDNIKFIKDIDKEVKVTVCAKEEEYSNYMNYYAQEYNVSDNSGAYSDYYEQTVSLIEKYNNYNAKIEVEFIDTQDSSFSKILSKYSNEDLRYGDIIVSCDFEGTERYKIVGYQDIYELYEDTSMQQYYGYTTTIVQGNNIETALTSAISYVVNNDQKKVAFLTGHSKEDLSGNYRELLETNNYDVDVIDDEIVNKISNEYDAIFLVAPNKDFIEDELKCIADFLDNGEKYGKGFVFVADATAPYLNNFYGFLEEWGIEVGDGVLFETDSNYHLDKKPTTMGTFPTGGDKIVNGMNYCITSTNIPLSPVFNEEGDKKLTAFFTTSPSVVIAPKGTSNSWNGADEYEKGSFASIIQSQRSAYDSNSNLIKNNIIALSSVDFVVSDLAEYEQTSNKNMSFAVAERAVGAEDTGISFVTKTITEESFAASVTETAADTVKWIFMILLPIACIVAGIVVYIRRRND